MNNHITNYADLATIVGFVTLGESPAFIAKELGVSEAAVHSAWGSVQQALLTPTETVEARSATKACPAPVPTQKSPQKLKYQPRKFRAVPGLATMVGRGPRDLTASLMGDPSAAAAERALCKPAPYRPSLKRD
ncbi:hypothetical protein [Roseibium album]|uniref:hypothetical protein n=1 Tax=Roseibium album TaxID=311410 RepID=UPI0024917BE3|nr:hypothetical protein [Roseibium album]